MKMTGSEKLLPKRIHPVFWVVVLTLAVAMLLIGSSVMGVRIAKRHVPLVDASMEIKLELALAHLWFEEAVSGDLNEDVAVVWAHLDESRWYATAMLEGGENSEGTFVALHHPGLCREIKDVQVGIADFRAIAKERWAALEQSGIGSDIDQHFDVVFEAVIQQVDEVETALQAAIKEDLFRFKVAQGLLVLLCLGLGGTVGGFLNAYEKKKRIHLSALRKSEENLSITLNSIGDAVIATDAEGCVSRMNPIAEALTGWPEADALTRPLAEVFNIIHAQTRKKADNPVEKVLREGIIVGLANHTALIARDGTERQIADSGAPIRDAEGGIIGVVLVFRDVTELYEKEAQLRANEAKYRTFFENSTDSMLIIEKGKFVDCNSAAVAMFGYDRKEEMTDVRPHKLSPELQPDERPSPDKADELMRLAKERGSLRFEWNHLRKDGTVIPVEVSLTAIDTVEGGQLHTVLRDITKRKRAEAEKERLSIAIAQVAEGVMITDADGTLQYVNPAFEKITGYVREEAIGQNPRVLKSGEHDDAFYRAMWKTLTAGKMWSGRLLNRKKDGSLYTEDAVISPVKNSAGRTVNYVAIKSDITVALVREEQIRQGQKLESIGRLAGGVAHDFNNILQTITGFSGLLLAEMDAKSAQRQDVLEIQAAVKHAASLTRQLLAFSRKQPTEYRSIDLNTVLSGAEKMLWQALDEGIQLKLELASRLEPVNADASQILQIAMNLTVNARDAMPEGGTVTLRTQYMEIKEKDLSGWPGSKVGAWICFSVADTGCGMDEKQLTHLFEPFYTTKQPGEGTGLGLSVVYGIVEEHGGWIHVDSDPGKGTTFKIFLPVHDAAGSGNGAIDYDAFLGKRILLVEDDPVIRELTAEILQDVGYAVTVAADAREAKQLFSEKTAAFDMLFSDVVLPDRNGIELAGFLLEQHPELPILLFSGHSDERVQARLIKEKGFSYIRKPFNLKQLLDTVDRTITGFQEPEI